MCHYEMSLDGRGRVMVGGQWNPAIRSPRGLQGANTQTLHVHLADGLDAHCDRARAAGATIAQEPSDQFYGDRTYRAVDLEGHMWTFAEHVRDVTRADAEATLGQPSQHRPGRECRDCAVLLDIILTALADPVRRRTVELLSLRPYRAGELADVLGVTPPTMSKHLRVLRTGGLVVDTQPSFDTRVRVLPAVPRALRGSGPMAARRRTSMDGAARRLRGAHCLSPVSTDLCASWWQPGSRANQPRRLLASRRRSASGGNLTVSSSSAKVAAALLLSRVAKAAGSSRRPRTARRSLSASSVPGSHRRSSSSRRARPASPRAVHRAPRDV